MKAHLLASTAIVVSCLCLNAPAAVIAHWTFNEGVVGATASGTGGVIDLSGHGHHGTALGLPFYRSSWSPSFGRSMQFDAVNDRVFVPDSSEFQSLTSFAIEAYVRIDGTPAGCCGSGMIFFRGDDRGGWDPIFMGYTTEGLGYIAIDDALNTRTILYTPSRIDSGNWLHLAATLDNSTGWLKIYVNHRLVASARTTHRPSTLALQPASAGVGIGSTQTATYPQLFRGLIDEVRVHNVAIEPAAMLANPCPADFNGDARTDLFDYLDFVDAFSGSAASADFNADGTVDLFDYLDFLNAFSSGC